MSNLDNLDLVVQRVLRFSSDSTEIVLSVDSFKDGSEIVLAKIGDVFQLIRFDLGGTELWRISLDRPATAIALGSKEEIYVAGDFIGQSGGDRQQDSYLACYDPFSGLLWRSDFGSYRTDQIAALSVGDDGCIYTTGRTQAWLGDEPFLGQSDIFLTKHDQNGRTLWVRQFGTAKYDTGRAIFAVEDGVIVSGGIDSNKSFVSKFRSDGTRDWITYLTVNSSYSSLGQSQAIAFDREAGAFYVAGEVVGNFGGGNANNANAVLTKISSQGQKEWTYYEGHSSFRERGFGVEVFGGYIALVGAADVPNGNYNLQTDVFVTIFSRDGVRLSSIHFGSESPDATLGDYLTEPVRLYAPYASEDFPIDVSVSDSGRIAIVGSFGAIDGFLAHVSLCRLVIEGSAEQGEMLALTDWSAVVDDVAYQWKADGIEIAGATAKILQLTQAEVGRRITVVASYTDQQGVVELVSSDATAAVGNVNDPPTGEVLVGGTLAQGQTLKVSNTLADLDGMGAIGYQWMADGINITGATDLTFTPTHAHVGRAISVVASYTDQLGTTESVISAPTAPVISLGNHIAALSEVYHWKSHSLLDDFSISVLSDRVDGVSEVFFTRPIYSVEVNQAITSADAMAALKIALGRNPNPDPDGPGPLSPAPVSPYQFIAADINADGRVTREDAQEILQHVVRPSDTDNISWLLISESMNFSNNVTRDSVPLVKQSVYEYPSQFTGDFNFVALLSGDVDGSWMAPDVDRKLPSTYFEQLVLSSSLSLQLAQFSF